MKTTQLLQLTFGIGSTILFSAHVNAQLYSSGNNYIPGNKVGIGTETPSSVLTIKNTIIPEANCVNCLSMSEQDEPAFEIISVLTQNPPTANSTNEIHKWAFRADETYSATYKEPGQSPMDAFEIGKDEVQFHSESASLTPYFHFSSTGATNNKFNIGFGAKTSGNNTFEALNSGQNGSMIVSKNGTLRFITDISNSTTYEPNLVIANSGNIGIGVSNPLASLHIDDGSIMVSDGGIELDSGDIHVKAGRLVVGEGDGTNQFEVKSTGYVVAREILVDNNEPIPDYVFDDDYELMSMNELRSYIESEHHLPNIPSASEYEEMGGIEVGELTRLLLEKQEELVLYILELEERIQSLETN